VAGCFPDPIESAEFLIAARDYIDDKRVKGLINSTVYNVLHMYRFEKTGSTGPEAPATGMRKLDLEKEIPKLMDEARKIRDQS